MTMADSSGYVLRPGEGRAIPMGAFMMTVKADDVATAGAFSLLEADEPPGFGPPMHTHEDAAEAFYVLAGEYRIFLGDDEYLCPAGSFVYVPAGVVHGFRVGDVPSRKLNLYSPAAMLAYFDGLSTAAAAGTLLDDAALAELALAAHMRVLGPVPEGYA
jgi:mannose-6-phosphate isomerase-like protein (cupin superfamily)